MCTIFLLCVLLVFIYIDIVKIIRFKFIKKIKLIGNVNDEIYFQSVVFGSIENGKKEKCIYEATKARYIYCRNKKNASND